MNGSCPHFPGGIKIPTFLKKEAAFKIWCKGAFFGRLPKKSVAEVTAEIYTIDKVAYGQGESAMCDQLLKEMEISVDQITCPSGRAFNKSWSNQSRVLQCN